MTLHGCGSCTARLRILFAMVLLSLSAGRSDAREPILPRPAGYQVIDSTSGALLLYRRIPLGNDSAAAYLQVVDLHRCAVRQLCVETSNQGLNEGKYYPPENNSPYFRRFLYTALDSILASALAAATAAATFASSTPGGCAARPRRARPTRRCPAPRTEAARAAATA